MSPRIKLVLLFLVMASPLAASYLVYYFWKPTGSVNYGELVPTKLLPFDSLAGVGGSTADVLKGKWVLLSMDSGNCDAGCMQKLYLMRQVRTAQGKHMERVVRACIVDDDALPTAAAVREYGGTVLLKGDTRTFSKLLAGERARTRIYLIDPLGNLVLRYPANPDARRMIKDLVRLLSVSQID